GHRPSTPGARVDELDVQALLVFRLEYVIDVREGGAVQIAVSVVEDGDAREGRVVRAARSDGPSQRAGRVVLGDEIGNGEAPGERTGADDPTARAEHTVIVSDRTAVRVPVRVVGTDGLVFDGRQDGVGVERGDAPGEVEPGAGITRVNLAEEAERFVP